MRGLPDCTLLLALLCGVAVVHCQYDDDFGAPTPPRLVIPGAVSLGPAPGGPPRRPLPRIQARRQQLAQPAEPAQAALRPRPRPPAGRAGRFPSSPAPTAVPQFFSPSAPAIQQRPIQLEENIAPRPVIEESEDNYDDDLPSPGSYSPSPSPSSPPPPPPPPPQKPAPTFRPERPVFRPERPALLPTPSPELNFVSPTRQQIRPTPAPEEPQFPRQSQFNRAQSVVRAPQKQVFSNSKQQDFEKPLRQHQRPQKPVAQVLRRYREDNPDGSITWGFENDDGSFKEETIGTDCITYGKYGYVDPEGNRREYTYNTGIPCDKDKNGDNLEQPSEGYIDYAENKYVLPNGDSIDLNKMVKNRARRPVQNTQYRN